MLRFQSNDCPAAVTVKRILSLGLCWLLAAGGPLLPGTAAASGRGAALHATTVSRSDPDRMLLDIYRALDTDDLRKALSYADKLVAAYPTFHLGQLIRGDLLMMQTHTVTSFGPANGPKDKLDDLREEAMVRLQSLRHRPDPDLLPRAILQLRDDQKHALLVDARHSRLYVYENHDGQPRYVADYYISQGKLGVNKLKAGDQKTPVGIYYITAHLPGARLPDFYGSGASPINYPNEWDRLNGRSGYGIWLHGTPADSYSRPPLSSDGCLVLTNPDLYKVANSVEIGKTPVVISASVEFVNKTRWTKDHNLALRLIENWRSDVESLNTLRVMANYSSHFKGERGEDLATWFARHEPFMKHAKKLTIKLRDVTAFFYPGPSDMIVNTFTQDAISGKSISSVRKRQYWVKEGAQWKILYELDL